MNNILTRFSCIGLVAAIIILATAIVILIIQTSFWDEFTWQIFLKKFMQNLTIAIVFLFVVVPEGLPLTAGLAIASTTILLYRKEKILVNEMDSAEKTGKVDYLLIGKTGTLTTENMKVEKIYSAGCIFSETNDLQACTWRDYLFHNILNNTSTHIDINHARAEYKPVGNATEVSLLNWLQEHNNVELFMPREYKVVLQVPFDGRRKKSLSVVKYANEHCIVFIKGSPEGIKENCHMQWNYE